MFAGSRGNVEKRCLAAVGVADKSYIDGMVGVRAPHDGGSAVGVVSGFFTEGGDFYEMRFCAPE